MRLLYLAQFPVKIIVRKFGSRAPCNMFVGLDDNYKISRAINSATLTSKKLNIQLTSIYIYSNGFMFGTEYTSIPTHVDMPHSVTCSDHPVINMTQLRVLYTKLCRHDKFGFAFKLVHTKSLLIISFVKIKCER